MSHEEVIAEAKRRQVSDPDGAIDRLGVSPLHRLSFRSMADQQLALS